MGYSIYIGERILIDKNHPNYDEETGEYFAVETISDIHAPTFVCNSMTDNINS
jgi:hypothetical protein